MKKLNRKSYKAMGFIEALIAIMIVGVASVVLMRIAANTLQDMVQNERIDRLTQYAVEGAVMVQTIATRRDGTFPSQEYWGVCFVPEKDENNVYVFRKEKATTNYVTYQRNVDRSKYKTEALVPMVNEKQPEFFRIACINSTTDPNPAYVVIEVIVGQISSEGIISKNAEVKDYVYQSIINL